MDNPNQYPNQPPSPQVAKLMERQSEITHKFYKNDQQLTPDDRKQLTSCFRRQMYAFPLVTLPVLYAAIRIPRSFFKNPRLRYVQVISGLSGVFIGSSLSQVLGYQYNLNSLTADSPSYHCYRILGQAPPQIGLRYYQNTLHHPELKMQDPDTIDWSSSLAFPMCLVFDRKPGVQKPPQHLYQRPDREAEKWRQGYEQNAKNLQGVEEKAPWGITAPDSASSPGPTGTSWDRVIQGQPSTPQAPRSAGMSSQRPLTEQEKFDALLDRERAANTDDFANDEKKW